MHHDQCVLHRLPVVAWAPGEPLKAALAVEADGGEIGGPHLEQNPLSLPGSGLGRLSGFCSRCGPPISPPSASTARAALSGSPGAQATTGSRWRTHWSWCMCSEKRCSIFLAGTLLRC